MRLDILKNGTLVQSVSLDAEAEYCIGRAVDNDIVLESPGISRYHAQIVSDDSGRIVVTDLGSTNGTFFNDTKVTTCQWKNPDDVVSIGDVQLRLSSSIKKKREESSDSIVTPLKNNSVFSEDKDESIDLIPVSTRTNSEKENLKRTFSWKNIFAESILILALALPFAAFLVIDQVEMNSFFLRLVQVESAKTELVWNVQKQQQIRRRLEKVKKSLGEGKFQLSQNILTEVLTKDPTNSSAIALQEKLTDVLQTQKQKKIRNQTDRKGKAQDSPTQLKSNEQLIIGYLKTIQGDITKKNYADCLTHAQKIIQISPGNQRAVQLINFCNNSMVEIVAARQAEENKKTQEEQIKTQLKKILRQGKEALSNKRYSRSLELLQKGPPLDPEKKYELTRKINQQIKTVRKTIKKLASGHVQRAKKEKSRGHAVKALHYYKLANTILPGDEKIKSLYLAQLTANQKTASNLYNEAIAYASLGSIVEAKTALVQAKKFAGGNRKLSDRIKKKLESLAKE